MRYLLSSVALLCVGLIVGCAPASQASRSASEDSGNPAVQQASAIPTATPAATRAPTEVASATSTVAASSTVGTPEGPAETPVPSDTPTRLPGVAAGLATTPRPADTPTPVPSDTPTVALPATPATLATPESGAVAQDLAAQGLKVYQQLYCGICHRLDAAGTAGMFGPPHNDMANIAEQRIHDPNYTGSAKTAAEYIRESIVSPATYIVEGYQQTRQHMPAYNQLSQTDLEALVQMLLQQK